MALHKMTHSHAKPRWKDSTIILSRATTSYKIDSYSAKYSHTATKYTQNAVFHLSEFLITSSVSNVQSGHLQSHLIDGCNSGDKTATPPYDF